MNVDHSGHEQTDDEGCDECAAAYMTLLNRFLATDDAQMFCQVTNLAPGCNPTLWLRVFGGDFMAEAKVLREGNVRPRRVTATGGTLAETMEHLASAVAEYLYPMRRNDAGAA